MSGQQQSTQNDELMKINQHQTNKSYIYKLLKCIAILEERIGVNDYRSFDLYRKIECKYCTCKMNTSHTHDHLNENELLKYIKIIAFEIDPFDNNSNTSKKRITMKHCQEERAVLLDKFPTVVLENIFKKCSHKMLIDLAKAYPHYLNDIINPIYWKFIKVELTELLFNQIDILTIIMYLNQNLRRLSFKECFTLNTQRLSLYFDYTPNLTHLELGRINDLTMDFIEILVNKLRHLVYVNFEWNCKLIRDEHLLELLKLRHLHSLDLSQCTFLTDAAILEFASKIEKLVYFNIDGIQYLNDDTIKKICELHCSTLQYFFLDGEESTDEAFSRIDLCTKLKLLHISYAKLLTKETLDRISSLTKLVSLTIRHTNISEPGVFEQFFQQSTFPSLKILHLEKCDSIDDAAMFYVPVCFPSIEELYIPWCWEIGEAGFTYVAEGCTNLKSIDLTGLNGITGETFERVPNEIMKNIQYINLTYCRGVSKETSKNVFRHILTSEPKILLVDYYNNPMTLESIFED